MNGNTKKVILLWFYLYFECTFQKNIQIGSNSLRTTEFRLLCKFIQEITLDHATDVLTIQVKHPLFDPSFGIIEMMKYIVEVNGHHDISDLLIAYQSVSSSTSRNESQYSTDTTGSYCKRNNESFKYFWFQDEFVMKNNISFNWQFLRQNNESRTDMVIRAVSVTREGTIAAGTLHLKLQNECLVLLNRQEGYITDSDFPITFTHCQILLNAGRNEVFNVLILNVQTDDNPLCKRNSLYSLKKSTADVVDEGLRRFCSRNSNYHPSELDLLLENGDEVGFFFSERAKSSFRLFFRRKNICSGVVSHSKKNQLTLTGMGHELNFPCTISIKLPFSVGITLSIKVNIIDLPHFDHFQHLKENFVPNCTHPYACVIAGNEQNYCICHGTKKEVNLTFENNKILMKIYHPIQYPNNMIMSYDSFNTQDNSCPYGWFVSFGYCYSIFERNSTWSEAEDICRSYSGHLVIIDKEEKQHLLDEVCRSEGLQNKGLWIGANDKLVENTFVWTDGTAFSYQNWYPGWNNYGGYRKQPSDDGFGQEDCVEMRALWHHITEDEKGFTETFYWNDRDCNSLNVFICQRILPEQPEFNNDCGGTIFLHHNNSEHLINTPGFPNYYPSNLNCKWKIISPINFTINLDFIHMNLENDENCSFDRLELVDVALGLVKNYCGNWNKKLKIAHQKSTGHQVLLYFQTDYSRSESGFLIKVSMIQEKFMCFQTNNFSLQLCYILYSFPPMSWYAADNFCKEKGVKFGTSKFSKTIVTKELGTPTPENWQWMMANIHSGLDASLYWISDSKKLKGSFSSRFVNDPANRNRKWCPSIKQLVNDSSNETKASFKLTDCTLLGGYLCEYPKYKKNKTIVIDNSTGMISSPNFPNNYSNNWKESLFLKGFQGFRIILKFTEFSLEHQDECLYDCVSIFSDKSTEAKRFCGDHIREEWISDANVAFIKFKTDDSITSKGFQIQWTLIDVTSCPEQLRTQQSDKIRSLNFPSFYLPNLQCYYRFFPKGGYVWIEFQHFNVGFRNGSGICSNDYVQIQADDWEAITLCGNMEKQIHKLKFLLTGYRPFLKFFSKQRGPGFEADYEIVSRDEKISTIISLENYFVYDICNMNYPLISTSNVSYERKLTTIPGNSLHLRIPNVAQYFENAKNCTTSSGFIIIIEPYLDIKWAICELDTRFGSEFSLSSYFNVLYIVERSNQHPVQYKMMATSHYVLKWNNIVMESCVPNPCLNGGTCMKNLCHCVNNYSGMFCSISPCDVLNCVHGICIENQRCQCFEGYFGSNCSEVVTPCSSNPCQKNGKCIVANDTWYCRCLPTWKGEQCQARIVNLTFKPLSQRMIEEPFWLGLLAVTVVMAFLGIFWCIKRRFADRLDKFMSEEIAKSKINSYPGSIIPAPSRKQSAYKNSPHLSHEASTSSLWNKFSICRQSNISMASIISNTAPAENVVLCEDLGHQQKKNLAPKKGKWDLSRCQKTPEEGLNSERKWLLRSLVVPLVDRRPSLDDLLKATIQRVRLKNDNKIEEVKKLAKIFDSFEDASNVEETSFSSQYEAMKNVRTLDDSSDCNIIVAPIICHDLESHPTNSNKTNFPLLNYEKHKNKIHRETKSSCDDIDFIDSSNSLDEISKFWSSNCKLTDLELEREIQFSPKKKSTPRFFKSLRSRRYSSSYSANDSEFEDSSTAHSPVSLIPFTTQAIAQELPIFETRKTYLKKSQSGKDLFCNRRYSTTMLEISKKNNLILSPIREFITPISTQSYALSLLASKTDVGEAEAENRHLTAPIHVHVLPSSTCSAFQSVSSDGYYAKDDEPVNLNDRRNCKVSVEEEDLKKYSTSFEDQALPSVPVKQYNRYKDKSKNLRPLKVMPQDSGQRNENRNGSTLDNSKSKPIHQNDDDDVHNSRGDNMHSKINKRKNGDNLPSSEEKRISSFTIPTVKVTICSPPPKRLEHNDFVDDSSKFSEAYSEKKTDEAATAIAPEGNKLPVITITEPCFDNGHNNDYSNRVDDLDMYRLHPGFRTISESNLSTSGYSSLTSPAPSMHVLNNRGYFPLSPLRQKFFPFDNFVPTITEISQIEDPVPVFVRDCSVQTETEADTKILQKQAVRNSLGDLKKPFLTKLNSKEATDECSVCKETIFVRSNSGSSTSVDAYKVKSSSLNEIASCKDIKLKKKILYGSESPVNDYHSRCFTVSSLFFNKEFLPFTDSDCLYDYPSFELPQPSPLKYKKTEKRARKKKIKYSDFCRHMPQKEYKGNKVKRPVQKWSSKKYRYRKRYSCEESSCSERHSTPTSDN